FRARPRAGDRLRPRSPGLLLARGTGRLRHPDRAGSLAPGRIAVARRRAGARPGSRSRSLAFALRRPRAAPCVSGARDCFGRPRGLAVVFLPQMWSQFSFFGMRALLVYYMTKELMFAQPWSSLI